MQDIHSIGSGGGGGRLFVGGDRRLRPHHGQIPQAMKCPRCESINTKFCYYNNYNLSQPRHFCKSCRRYWTKGGVLRNVPVGGGCRKTKRSKPKPNTNSSDVLTKEQKSSNSSSESSSLTATTTATATLTIAATEDLSGSSSNSASTLLNFQETKRLFNIPQSTTANPSFGPPLIDQSPESAMFPEIGSFTGLMTTSSNNDHLPLSFNIADISSYRSHQQRLMEVVENQQCVAQQKMMENDVRMHELELDGGYLDLSEQQNRRNEGGGLAAVDWESGGDEGLFDLAGTTVDQSYWKWPEHDHHLNYLP